MGTLNFIANVDIAVSALSSFAASALQRAQVFNDDINDLLTTKHIGGDDKVEKLDDASQQKCTDSPMILHLLFRGRCYVRHGHIEALTYFLLAVTKVPGVRCGDLVVGVI